MENYRFNGQNIKHDIFEDIVNVYLYASSVRSLWLDLEAHYGECEGPLLYKIPREIGSMTQGNMTVTAYYTNMKQLWDELACLMPPAMFKPQRQVNLGIVDSGENSTLLGKGYENRGASRPRNNIQRKGLMDERNLICENCHKAKHSKETYFRLHGVPNWYKELTDQRKRNGNGSCAYAVNDSNSVDVPANAGSDLVADLMEAQNYSD
ncbi:UNVERIFIED_CONTAM: hypothetical protein Sradi_3615000 [Sesamum radiatum]|uniref:Retrotransposon gag domain-containing protein n=1 Tax=Sesamum radiatum TaxID=300843 RepID=A0AAW2QHI0_SESRA